MESNSLRIRSIVLAERERLFHCVVVVLQANCELTQYSALTSAPLDRWPASREREGMQRGSLPPVQSSDGKRPGKNNEKANEIKEGSPILSCVCVCTPCSRCAGSGPFAGWKGRALYALYAQTFNFVWKIVPFFAALLHSVRF